MMTSALWLRVGLLLCALFLLLGLVAGAAIAQRGYDAPVEVYVARGSLGGVGGTSRLFFVDSVTGEVLTVDVHGQRYTVVGEYVLYQDPDTGALLRAWPDGRTEPHPFIQPAPETERIDWVVSPDRAWIAWTLTNQAEGGQLATVTTLARADGTEPRIILTDGPDAFWRVLPLALTDERVFFFDRQPQGVAGFFFYPQYASLYRLDAGTGATQPELLPFEPNCFCGAGLSADGQFFYRLERVDEAGGYDARVWDLAAGVDIFASSISPPYRLAGAVLVAPDGRRAVYSLANNLTIDSADSGRERFMLALIDAEQRVQRPLLSSPSLVPLLPLAWTEDGQGVLLYNPRQDGTWKLILETGEVRQVAGATWVGLIW